MRMYLLAAGSMVLLWLGMPAMYSQSPSCCVSAAPQTQQSYPSRDELIRQIKVCQDARRNAESMHAAHATLGRIDVVMGALYEEVGSYAEAGQILERAVTLLRTGPPLELASGLRELAMLHANVGDPRKAEKENREAIGLFEGANQWMEAAFTRVALANAELRAKHFADAAADARAAADALGDDLQTRPIDVVAAHQTLGAALAKQGRCPEAISVLKNTVDLAKRAFGEDSLPVGAEYYVLGHAAWDCDDAADAAAWMQRGIERMKRDLGWGQSVYLENVAEYARFLRQRGQMGEADAEEREVRMANSVVDVRAMAAPTNGLR